MVIIYPFVFCVPLNRFSGIHSASPSFESCVKAYPKPGHIVQTGTWLATGLDRRVREYYVPHIWSAQRCLRCVTIL